MEEIQTDLRVQYYAFLYFYRWQVNAIFVQPTSLAM